jgi:hypothetical protein
MHIINKVDNCHEYILLAWFGTKSTKYSFCFKYFHSFIAFHVDLCWNSFINYIKLIHIKIKYNNNPGEEFDQILIVSTYFDTIDTIGFDKINCIRCERLCCAFCWISWILRQTSYLQWALSNMCVTRRPWTINHKNTQKKSAF